MTGTAGGLSPGERATLRCVCAALLPALQPEAGDDPRLFTLAAGDLGVPAAMEQAIGSLDPAQQEQFRQLIRALEQLAMIGLLIGTLRRFSDLDSARRERALRAMATSRVPLLRTGFHGLKRLATFLFYSLTDDGGSNPAWPAIGYAPQPPAPASPSALAMTVITAPTTHDCDVCAIGSGAGGGVVAGELAAASKDPISTSANWRAWSNSISTGG